VIPESVDSSQTFYLLGTIVLIIGVVAGLASLLIRRRREEAHRDERYVRERRGERVAPIEHPRLVGALQYAGVSIAAIGILLLVAGWTLAPGPN
jgi:protein-S-isoprenylcysteine O-methyltransferase Ste14